MKRAKGGAGFTLIELIAALGILAMVAIPLTRLFIDSFNYQARSQKNDEIAKMAEFVVEKFKNGDMEGMTDEDDSSIVGKEKLPTDNDYTAIIILEKVVFEVTGSPNQISENDATVVVDIYSSAITSTDVTKVAAQDPPNYVDNTVELQVALETDGPILIRNNEEDKWSIVVNNQSGGKLSIYTQREYEAGTISLINTPDTPSIIIYDLGTNLATAELQYAVYDVAVGVREGLFTDVSEMGESTWDYTLRTTLRKEITV